MSFTAFGTSDNLPSSWPAGVRYDHNSSRYVYSVSASYQIAALQHVHVVDIDLPQILFAPNVMTLTLPIMKNLPLESRLYFFYVSQANPNDQLTFFPVTGSGNTINGNAVSYTFVLTGQPELFIAIGVNDNYIIHAFGKNNNGDSHPTENYQFSDQIGPLYGTAPENMFSYATSDMFLGDGAPSLPVTIITGMEGFLTANTVIPTQAFRGWLCNQSGIYIVQPSFVASLLYTIGLTGTMLGPLQAVWLEFNADGSFNDVVASPAFVPFVAEGAPSPSIHTWRYNSAFFMPLHAGKFYLPAFTWDSSSTGTIVDGGIDGSLTFVYWAPIPPTPPPTLLSARANSASSSIVAVQAANKNPDVFAPISKGIAGAVAASIQKSRSASAQQGYGRGGSGSSGGSPSSIQPLFSLNDMERMINQALDARDSRASVVASSSLISSSASSSSSSSSSSAAGKEPETKKRKTSFAKKG